MQIRCSRTYSPAERRIFGDAESIVSDFWMAVTDGLTKHSVCSNNELDAKDETYMEMKGIKTKCLR
jgi:hypothetical protein